MTIYYIIHSPHDLLLCNVNNLNIWVSLILQQENNKLTSQENIVYLAQIKVEVCNHEDQSHN